MLSIVRLHPRNRSPRAIENNFLVESEAESAGHLGVHIAIFSVTALAMYTVVVLVMADSWDASASEILWMLWLVFVIGVSKLVLATGVWMMIARADKKSVAVPEARPRSRTRKPARIYHPSFGNRSR